jgi:hypothetical protein
MMAGILEWATKKVTEKRQKSEMHMRHWCSLALKRLQANGEEARAHASCILNPTHTGGLVKDQLKIRYTVSLEGKGSCSCGDPKDMKFPCSHLLRVLWTADGHKPYQEKRSGEEYIDELYSTEKWRECYNTDVPLIALEQLKPAADVKPPQRMEKKSCRPVKNMFAS